MNPRPPDRELRRLVDRLRDGPPLRKPEMARLEELLEKDEALIYYQQVIGQEAILPVLLAEMAPAGPGPARPRRRIPLLRMPVIVATAACLAFMSGYLLFRLGWSMGQQESIRQAGPGVREIPPLPARITGLVGVEWAENSARNLLAEGAVANQIAIQTGLVEVSYGSGVRLTIQGPADFTVSDPGSGRLRTGKVYATVPKGAEGFRIDYDQGAIVDLGTEFAIEALANGTTEVGVFDGEIEMLVPGRPPLSIFENQAMKHSPGSIEPVPVPLDRAKFIAEMPSRDFKWEIRSDGPQVFEVDVTHLVWRPSEYRAIFKWMTGRDDIRIHDVRLCLDGRTVTADDHPGVTGDLLSVRDNIYALQLNAGEFSRGRWTIRATIQAQDRTGQSIHSHGQVHSEGILQFEEGFISQASEEDFIGRWTYRFGGSRFVREFHRDGTVTLERNGEPLPTSFIDSRWTLEDGVLHVSIPQRATSESHVLRDQDTLIFVNNPYENARRVGSR